MNSSMQSLLRLFTLTSLLLAACGDSGSGGAGGTGGSDTGGSDTGGSDTGGSDTGGTGGGTDYSADIATFCTNIDLCWDDATPCVQSVTEGIAANPGCDAELVAMFECMEANGVVAPADCEDTFPCLAEVTPAYECIGFK
jgi:hypothetical protein